MFLKDNTFDKIELIIGDTHCSLDGSKGPESSCHVKISQSFLSELIREDYSQVEKISVRWLKEPLVWADISTPARLSYQILEWLSKLDPLEDPEGSRDSRVSGVGAESDACDSSLFLTPQLAHYAAMVKKQGLGLRRTNVIVYFEHSTVSGRATLLREELSLAQEVEQQEAMYMEATAATLADATIVDNTALLRELDSQARDLLPASMRVPAWDGVPGRRVFVLPFLPSTSQASLAGKGAALSSHSKYDDKALRFEGTFTYQNGLATILDGLSHMHSNVTEIGEVEVTFAGTDAWNSNLKYRGEQSPTKMGTDVIRDALGELRGYRLGIHTQRSEIIKAKQKGGLQVIVNFAGTGGGVRRVLECVMQSVPFVAYESILEDFARTLHITDKKFVRDLKVRHGILDPGHDVKGTLLAKNLWDRVKDEVSRKDCVATTSVYKVVSQYVSDSKPRLLNLYKSKMLRQSGAAEGSAPGDTSALKVSVVIVTHNRPETLQQAAKSIVYQSHKKTEVIVIDNASTHSGTSAALDAVKALVPEAEIVRLSDEMSLSAARNLGASKASGDYVLFMDDDNVAMPREVEIMLMTALRTKADVISPGNQYFVGDVGPYDTADSKGIKPINKWLPLGPSPSIGLYKDVYGDSNALFKKSAFDAYGGFQEHKAVNSSWEGEMAKATGEDWELLARMTLGGASLEVVPIPMFWYRLSADALSKASSRNLYLGKVVSPFVDSAENMANKVPALNFVAPALRMAQAAYHKESLTSPKFNLNGLDGLLNMIRAATYWDFGHGCTLEDIDNNLDVDEGKNWLLNSKFEDIEVEEATHWESYGNGYEATRYIDGIKMTSKSISDEYGAKQTIKLKNPSALPIFVAAQSTQLEGLPSKFPEGYSMYVDLEYEDKTMGYGYMVTFSKPLESHVVSNATSLKGMKRWKCGLIVPTKPVKTIFFHLLYRRVAGSVVFHRGIVRHLEYRDVCKAFLSDPIVETAPVPALEANGTSTEAGKNDTKAAGISSRSMMDCQGYFTKHTPILF